MSSTSVVCTPAFVANCDFAVDRRFVGADDLTDLYECQGVYVFDTWVKPGPYKNESSVVNAVKEDPPGKAAERLAADSRVVVSDSGEKALDKLDQWQLLVNEYESHSREKIPDSVKIMDGSIFKNCKKLVMSSLK